ncbi:MAG: beta-ketoacyl-[acyl-carrier-protein] synthase family protein [Candidatus Omnitrophica bacterium]|nr:beta-ketoacyl-[acyl-carrier-protein] synthase family protein [Candidatus Omnitrophota bacterium]
MEQDKIVITGVGVIAPNGIGKENFWEALRRGKNGIKPITIFDTAPYKAKLAGEIYDFDPAAVLGPKGLRDIDRATKLLCSSAKLALDDANLVVNDSNTDKIGVCTGTTLSSLGNLTEFNRQVIKDGPLFTDVGLFPGTVINAASSHVSIRFNIQGFNSTISNGFTSSLDALKYAADFIKFGKADVILLCGVESLNLTSFCGLLKIGFLAGINGPEISCPFDRRRNGMVIGEGAAVLILESETHAKKRNANIYCEVKSATNRFSLGQSTEKKISTTDIRKCMHAAITAAGVLENEIDFISANANSTNDQDKTEALAIKETFNDTCRNIPVSSIKSMVGETYSASGALQLAAAIGNITNNFINPILNFEKSDIECSLDFVSNAARQVKLNTVLVNNFGPEGNCASAVISRYK